MATADDASPDYLTGIGYPLPFADLAVELSAGASRDLCILSPALDHAVFDREPLADALSALARRSRRTRVRVVISDSRPLTQRGHRLLNLARRLPTSISIQCLSEHPDWQGETLLVRDRSGLLYRPAGGDDNAFYEPDSPASASRQLDRFEEFWRLSSVDRDLRQLLL